MIANLQKQYGRLQDRLDAMYIDKLDGRIAPEFFDRKSEDWRREQADILRKIEKHQNANHAYLKDGGRILELAQHAVTLYEKQEMDEKRRLLNFVFSNSSWRDGRLTPVYRNPFDLLAVTNLAYQREKALFPTKEGLFDIWLPKAVEYVLRLTGVIHCMQQFSIGKTPQAILTVGDLERGIKTVNFYMGQIQGAIRLIEEEFYSPPEISKRSLLLAQTLDQLRLHLENERLAIGFIHKQYNLVAPETQKIGKPRGMGAVLRAVKLTISPDKHEDNGHRAAKCFEWDTQTETFIAQCLQCLQSQKNQNRQGLEGADVKESMSASSAAPSEGFEDIPDISERMSALETFTSIGPQDNADVADIATEAKEFTPSPDWQGVPEGAVMPPGADIRMDMATGKNHARWPDGVDNVGSGIGETEQEDLVGEDPGESILEVEI
jgi:hypothetical protein